MDYEAFRNEKEVIDWLMSVGVDFHEAMLILSYAIQSDKSLICAYFTLCSARSHCHENI